MRLCGALRMRFSELLLCYTSIRTAAIRNATNTLALTSMLHDFATFLEAFLICHPISAGWDPSVNRNCGDQVASYLALETIGLLIDCAIFIIPIMRVSKIQMSLRRKLRMIGLLSIVSL